MQADWDKFIDGINNAFDLIPELADATRDGDRDKLQSLTTEFTQIADGHAAVREQVQARRLPAGQLGDAVGCAGSSWPRR